MWCEDTNFWDWLYKTEVGCFFSNYQAKYAIYDICDIKSRAELDNNPEAAEKFHRLIRVPYSEYLKTI